MPSSNTLNVLALIALAGSIWLPPSPARDGLRFFALGYMIVHSASRIRAGYLRRRPHWTRQSWRQFAIGCSIPAGALFALVGIFTVFALQLPIIGEPGSPLRRIWATSVGLLAVTGGVGLSVVRRWLAAGEPDQQFELPRWFRRRRSDSAV